MNYQETLQYMFSQLPMFQRIGAAAYKADLNNTIEICQLLGNPETKFRSIHIAGTNGKGSTSHMLAAVLQKAGYKTGLYTSPHLKDFRERIRINGKMISKNDVVEFIDKHKKDFERIQPSFFEMTVGLAFDHFAKKKVDIAVIETGLGGRLDSTNVITPELSIITNISYDHQNLLGNTLEKIAGEKAGIIKRSIPAVIGETQKEVKHVFISKAKEQAASVYFADKFYKAKSQSLISGHQVFLIKDIKGNREFKLKCELKGSYQSKNVCTVLKAIDILKRTNFSISSLALQQGIANVSKLTGLRGRWDMLSKEPLIIADTGHNVSGIKEVLKQIKLTPHHRLHFVLGMVNDKDVSTVLSLLPKKATYYFCKASIPRALDVDTLIEKANQASLKGLRCNTVKDAIKKAKQNYQKGDLIFVGGSTFVVADAI